MPVPVNLISDLDKSFFQGLDLSTLMPYVDKPVEGFKKLASASNEDANLLFQIWSSSQKNNDGDSFKIAADVNPKDVLKLKTRGLISGGADDIKFTKKGKMVITVMALSEPSKFEKLITGKKYNEILASMDKRGKPGYRVPKFASNNNNCLNLRQS
jgi:hypothetical protein